MTTIQDVAKEAKVSVATISRVMNNSPSVKPETREMVQAVIKKLNYQPNLLGRNLRRSETKMVLVLLPNISNSFYTKVVKGIEDIAHKNGYNILLCNTDLDINREKMYIDMLKNRLADGIIFMAPELDKNELTEIGKRFPLVQCCEHKRGASVSNVCIDNKLAAIKVTKYLLSLGHKKIAMISCNNNFVSTSDREDGFKKALEESDIQWNGELIKYGDYTFKSGIFAARQLLAMKEKPSAIFAISDMMAIGAIKEIKAQGLRVPKDIAVVGFDNINFSSMYDPALTTVSQHQYDLGCNGMELLLKQIRGEVTEPQEIILEHELIIREST